MVGLVSPSSPITPDLEERLSRGIETLERLGLRVKFGKHARDRYFYSAGTASDRAADFNEMWADPEVAMLLMTLGGPTANHLLDGIDFQSFEHSPKIFAGMSDGTTLLTAIHARAGIVTFHGPDLLFGFGRPMTRRSEEHLRALLMNGEYGPIPCTQTALREGRASGPLVGGHVGILIMTMFAGYAPDLRGAILFLEGTEQIHILDRQLTALRLHGVFDRIAGLVIGHFEGHEPPDVASYRSPADVVLEVTRGYDFPIIEIEELGHNVENVVLPIGVMSTIDTARSWFSLDEPAVV